MILVSNGVDQSHLTEMQELLADKPDEVIIVSPFLARNIGDLLSQLEFEGTDKLILITTFIPKNKEQLTKPFQLRQLKVFLREKYPQMSVKIHINNSLHGKLYFFSYENSKKLLVSSANFTFNGMLHNSEWGVLHEDKALVEQAKEEVFADIDIEGLTDTQLKNACLHAQTYLNNNPSWVEEPDIIADILAVIRSGEDDANVNPKYFIKPIGHTEGKILKEEKGDFSDEFQNQHFSTSRKPNGVRKGDYLITTAVGAGSLLSYFKVTGLPELATEEEIAREEWLKRWGWYVETKNQSPEFGSLWWKHDLQRNLLVDEFLAKHPELKVTKVGGNNLLAINHGADKIQVTPEFGRFLIEKIDGCV